MYLKMSYQAITWQCATGYLMNKCKKIILCKNDFLALCSGMQEASIPRYGPDNTDKQNTFRSISILVGYPIQQKVY